MDPSHDIPHGLQPEGGVTARGFAAFLGGILGIVGLAMCIWLFMTVARQVGDADGSRRLVDRWEIILRGKSSTLVAPETPRNDLDTSGALLVRRVLREIDPNRSSRAETAEAEPTSNRSERTVVAIMLVDRELGLVRWAAIFILLSIVGILVRLALGVLNLAATLFGISSQAEKKVLETLLDRLQRPR